MRNCRRAPAKAIRNGSPLDEVLRLRDHFATEGAAGREYRPWRPEGLPAKILAVANFKGGVGKTSTAAHLAMSAALDDYKVLVVDLDSQGSMTSIMGGKVRDEWSTAFPLLAKDALALQDENHVAPPPATPLPFDETATEALKLSAQDLIQPTHWLNIDLLGAQVQPLLGRVSGSGLAHGPARAGRFGMRSATR